MLCARSQLYARPAVHASTAHIRARVLGSLRTAIMRTVGEEVAPTQSNKQKGDDHTGPRQNEDLCKHDGVMVSGCNTLVGATHLVRF